MKECFTSLGPIRPCQHGDRTVRAIRRLSDIAYSICFIGAAGTKTMVTDTPAPGGCAEGRGRQSECAHAAGRAQAHRGAGTEERAPFQK